ncbi:ParB/RepB/Spo0J family partition protein [Candidatus Uabimicrobium amorphum]|uniref:Putative chromosome-partitioning protein ParB n=1 Tax=Uabimicrobium amorphum TaxID=2596890 RepID=A0A5S9IR85_UABAM|nr:ParB/RepB/Spo0J family partition protein [Candidatus Uabimicrobium amorphum]BBM85680.1 putative chromosome-partitioning protein ParB [Candidatus Uabimicrobium amorphum]
MDLLRMVVKKRSEDNTRVKDSDSLSRFATRVAKLKGEGPLASSAEPEVTLEVISINIIDIEVPKTYMRKSLGDLSALVSSVKLYGIQQPIKVIKVRGTNKYRLVYGLRRLEAAKKAGHDSVPCIVELVTIENRLQTLSMVENFARLSLNPIEQANAFKAMGDKMTDELCRNIGKTSGYVQEAISLLSLPESVQEEVMAEPDLYTWGILMVLIKTYGSSNAHGRKLFQAVATGKVNTAKEAEFFVQSLG